jgi:hypothetical protein
MDGRRGYSLGGTMKRFITWLLDLWFKRNPIFTKPTPLNLEEAVDHYQRYISIKSHFERGMAVRNGFKLWERDSPLKAWFKENHGISHPDDIYMVIRTVAENRKKGLPDGIEALKAKIDRHWAAYDLKSNSF